MLIACPQPGKTKSREIVSAFVEGCRRTGELERVEATVFFGCVGIESAFRDAQRGCFFYGDNSYWDVGRPRFIRFTKNAFQVSTLQPPDEARFKALGLKVRPWRKGGHVVVIEQSAHFLNLSGAGGDWLNRTVAELRKHTDRELRIRRWNRDKGGAGATLQADLEGAHAVVGWMTAAMNEALLAGVPVFALGPCAATPMASGALSEIERPRYPDGREAWAAGLAGAQWTLSELRDGLAWRALNP